MSSLERSFRNQAAEREIMRAQNKHDLQETVKEKEEKRPPEKYPLLLQCWKQTLGSPHTEESTAGVDMAGLDGGRD